MQERTESEIRNSIRELNESIDILRQLMSFDDDAAGALRLEQLVLRRSELFAELLRSAVGVGVAN
jgi:hypothetical protein